MIRWFLIAVLAAGAGAFLLVQRETASALRSELVLLREGNQELARLKAEHARLLAAQAPKAELDRLRADRAVLERLRSEIDTMKQRAEEMARAERDAAAATPKK